MDYRKISAFGLTALLMLAAHLAAQEPAKDEPVKKELEAFQKDMAAKAPAERLKAYEEGIELVKKSGVIEKALKVGDKAPTSSCRTPRARRSSSPPC